MPRLKYFMIGVVACLFSTQPVASEETVPCSVRIIFEESEDGPAVSYLLTTHVKNRTARPVSAVSLLLLNDEGEVIGNSDAICLLGGDFLRPGDIGQCQKVLQSVTPGLMEAYGSEMWTKIVNDQLGKMQRISSCKLLGMRYGSAAQLQN